MLLYVVLSFSANENVYVSVCGVDDLSYLVDFVGLCIQDKFVLKRKFDEGSPL